MKPGKTLALLALILIVAVSVSFLGYRYLGLASEYRKRNLIHLRDTEQILEVLSGQEWISSADWEELRGLAMSANMQATWCTANLSTLEQQLFVALGAERALTICHENTSLGTRMLAEMENLSASNVGLKQSDYTLILRDRLPSLREMAAHSRAHSIEFSPYVDIVEEQISRAVRFGTLGLGLCMGLLFWKLALQMARSIKDQERQNAELNLLSSRFTAALQASSDGIAIFDADARLLLCNEIYRELSHTDPSNVALGMEIDEIFRSAVYSGHYDLQGLTPQQYLDAYDLQRQKTEANAKSQLALSNDRHVVVTIDGTPLGDKFVVRCDITDLVRSERRQREVSEELRRAKDNMEFQALTDPLTGLPNRRRLERELNSLLYGQTQAVTLIRIDLDRFKKVNDVLGHEAGDHVLLHVAELLRDQQNTAHLAARVGGDEFVVLCAPGSGHSSGVELAEQILEAATQPIYFAGKRCHFGASFGVATGLPGEMSPSELLSNADSALYLAKGSGRGKVAVFTSEMRRAALAERELADRVHEALENGELVPYYQTQHLASDWSVFGVEVLARWQHPQRGLLTPDKFLGLVGQLGLEAELDRHMFEAAVTHVNELERNGMDLGRVAFNVSAARIMEAAFLETVSQKIPTERHRYAFEILESISFEDLGDALLYCVDSLKELGFQVDVDDFGSGHASINGVLNIEPHALKIDRNIIFPIGQSERASRMVGAVVELAKALDVQVIAEGVETKEKAEILHEMGCDVLQGYYFSKPMSVRDLTEFMGQSAKSGTFGRKLGPV